MADLVSRLLEAITETERVAREATEGPWRAGSRGGPTVEAEGWTVASGVTDLDAAHIAHNDPSSVLRRCAADNRTVELHRNNGGFCSRCFIGSYDEEGSAGYPYTVIQFETFPCATLRNTAEAYGLEVTE